MIQAMDHPRGPGRPVIQGREALSHLRRWLAEGRFATGVPSERRLAEELGVARVTVRAALARLETEGLLAGRERQRRNVVPPRARGALTDTVVALSTQDPATYTWAYPAGFSGALRHDTLAALEAAGWRTQLQHPTALRGDALMTLLRRRPAALVLLYEVATGPWGREIAETAAAHQVRVIAYAEAASLPSAHVIHHDHAHGAAGLTAWLIGRGRRHILPFQLGGAHQPWQSQRLRGYQQACAEHGMEALAPVATVALPANDNPDAASFAQQACIAAGFLIEHLRGPQAIDALLLPSDAGAAIAAAALRRCGLEPNRDVWLAGYDHTFAWQRNRRHEPTGPLISWDKDDRSIAAALVNAASGEGPTAVPGHLVELDPATFAQPYRDPWPDISGS